MDSSGIWVENFGKINVIFPRGNIFLVLIKKLTFQHDTNQIIKEC